MYYNLKLNLTVISYLLSINLIYSQVINEETANKLFINGNYIEAVKMYESLLKKDPGNLQFNINAGTCYLEGHLEHSKAVPFFEKVEQAGIEDPELIFLHAFSLQHALRLDEAKIKFEEYKKSPKADSELATKHLMEVEFTKKMLSQKMDITFERLGPNVNTEFADYYPFVSKDDNILIYTTRTNRSMGGFKEKDGYYTSDIYYSLKQEEAFIKSKSIGSLINTNYDDQCVGLSDDGNTMFIYSNKEKSSGGDIFYSNKTAKSFKKPTPVIGSVNTSSLESSASIAEDGNTLFYSSKKPGGKGELDLYMTRKLPTGEWGEPQNIEAINTKYNEDFPTLSEDGRTLYFSSEGHDNMGGYDLFKSTWNPETNDWSSPTNLGYPINSPANDMVISFLGNGYQAYVSAIRPEGMGDYDIYKVTFNSMKPKTVLKLDLIDQNSEKRTDHTIYVYDKMNNEVAHANADNSGAYMLILTEGKYNLEIESPEGDLVIKELIIDNEMITQGMSFLTITLD